MNRKEEMNDREALAISRLRAANNGDHSIWEDGGSPFDDVQFLLAAYDRLAALRASAAPEEGTRTDEVCGFCGSGVGETCGASPPKCPERSALAPATEGGGRVQSAIELIDDYERHGSIDHGVAFEIKRRLSSSPSVGTLEMTSADRAAPKCICDTDHPLFKERGHHPYCPASTPSAQREAPPPAWLGDEGGGP